MNKTEVSYFKAVLYGDSLYLVLLSKGLVWREAWFRNIGSGSGMTRPGKEPGVGKAWGAQQSHLWRRPRRKHIILSLI